MCACAHLGSSSWKRRSGRRSSEQPRGGGHGMCATDVIPFLPMAPAPQEAGGGRHPASRRAREGREGVAGGGDSLLEAPFLIHFLRKRPSRQTKPVPSTATLHWAQLARAHQSEPGADGAISFFREASPEEPGRTLSSQSFKGSCKAIGALAVFFAQAGARTDRLHRRDSAVPSEQTQEARDCVSWWGGGFFLAPGPPSLVFR